MNTLPSIREAVDDLYRVFEKYTLPSYTDPCLHCHTMEDEAKLHSKPLRLLQWQDLERYANDALLVWGDVDTFKHLLPRLFDLYLYSDDPEIRFLDPEILFSKFRHGGWQRWPEDEQVEVRHFFHAIWMQLLDDPPTDESEFTIETWLCAICQSEDDLSYYLDQWICVDSLEATLALSATVIDSSRLSAFWDAREPQFQQLKLWLTSKEVTDKIGDAEACFEDTLGK